jgi:phosphopantothenoylcysteine decarboxylase/phosphopantothenate--cysteine ligase
MHRCVLENITGVDIFVSAAAVCDFRPHTLLSQKIKKDQAGLSTQFERNPDILASISQLPQRPYCVGFAAETENHVANAQQKLRTKQCDAIAVNDVSREDIGFDVDANALHLIPPTHQWEIPKGSKAQVAHQLFQLLIPPISESLLCIPSN